MSMLSLTMGNGLFDRWRCHPARFSSSEALVRLRETWKQMRTRSRASIKDRDIPIRSADVPWWQYRPGRDIVEPVVDPEGAVLS